HHLGLVQYLAHFIGDGELIPLHQSRCLFDLLTHLVHEIDGALAGHGFDATHTGGNAALGDDLEEADVTGALGVSTAAQLGGVVAHAHDAHVVFIFFTKQRHGTGRLGRFQIHYLG